MYFVRFFFYLKKYIILYELFRVIRLLQKNNDIVDSSKSKASQIKINFILN